MADVRRHPIWIAGWLLIWFNCSSIAHAEPVWTGSSKMPFRPGEKLTFELRWEAIPAGVAVLEVRPIKSVDDQQAYHFVLTATSNSFVDVFYKVRDRIEAYADIHMTRSVRYIKKQHEGRRKRDIVVTFDWTRHQALYSNHGKKRRPIDVMPGSFDPLSAFYFARMLDFEDKSLVSRPVTDGKKNVIGIAKIIRRETVDVSFGRFDCFLVEPDLKHVGGVFEKSKNAKIQLWVTADERRIPVKIKSKVVVGSFIGELIAAQGI